MKKCLLSLAMSLLIGSSLASAEAVKAPFSVEKAPKMESRAATDDGYQLRFCGDLSTWYRITNTNNATYKVYIEITPEVATSLAGNKLTDISFSAVLQSASTKPGTVFVTEDLSGDPLVSQNVNIKNSYNNGYGGSQTVKLDTPYEIKEGVGFAFGYTVTKCSSSQQSADYPIGVDDSMATAFSGKADAYNASGTLVESADFSEGGMSVFLYANTVGEKKELNNVFALSYLTLGDFALPIVDASAGSVNVLGAINNLGSNPVTSFDYAYSINGADPVAGSAEVEIDGGTTGGIMIPVEIAAAGRNNLQVAITAINGVNYGQATEMAFIALDNPGFDRKFVVEEGTGTGCGYCPRGIVGLETMAELHPEKFIGIAVHCDWFGTDPMTVQSYQPLLSTYFDGLPSCIVNRDPIFVLDPNADYLEMVYDYWADQAGVVEVDFQSIQVNEDTSTMSVETTTTFAFNDADARYSLAFVILEDGLKGIQSNYFAGQNVDMGGWEKKGSKVSWTYSDTARDIFNMWGLGQSIPSSVEQGTAYQYNYDLSLANVKNIVNTSVVALVLDQATGTILNAKKVDYADYSNPSGLNTVGIEADAPIEYYNIQGVRMNGDNLPAGLYIIRQGDKVQKSIIR